MMEGMTAEDKLELMSSMMPTMMSQMFSGEGGASSMMMQMMRSMRGAEKEGEGRTCTYARYGNTRRLQPLGAAPARKLCEKAFQKKSK